MPDNVEAAFHELRVKGLLDVNRTLKRKQSSLHPLLTFRAGSFFFPGAICYSSRLSGLAQREAEFALLHEEGHLVLRQNSWLLETICKTALKLMLLAAAMAAASILLVLLDTGVNLEIVSVTTKLITGTVFVLALAAIGIKLKRHAELSLDEDNSDDFAAERLKTVCGVSCPSTLLADLLESLGSDRPILGKVLGFVLRAFGGDVHRVDSERIKRIADKYDDPPCS